MPVFISGRFKKDNIRILFSGKLTDIPGIKKGICSVKCVFIIQDTGYILFEFSSPVQRQDSESFFHDLFHRADMQRFLG